jgi:Tol biopolymer transport system component
MGPGSFSRGTVIQKGGAKGFDLYVKALGSETLLRLTQHPSEWISSAWSPDGTQIAFHRVAGADTGIYVVPALGGPERKLRATRVTWGYPLDRGYPLSIISWSPDGKRIALTDVLPEQEHAGIYLLSTETLETKQIPRSLKCADEGVPAFSHNGEYLAYWCFRDSGKAALYSLPLRGGESKRFSLFRDWPTGLTWSADDKELIYSLWYGKGGELGELTVANGSVKTLAIPVSAEMPTVSAKGDKLAFSTAYGSVNIWRRDLLHPQAPPVELIPSSREQGDGQYSPDRKRIAFTSDRSGLPGVWIGNEDGSNLVQVSPPAPMSGSPQWSPDGNKVAFDLRSQDRLEIYVTDVSQGVPRKLVTNISKVYRPHWSRDGKWIYFTSDEPGRTGIYRCPASGGDAIVLSRDIDGFSPRESFDGETVYFVEGSSKPVLRKVSLLEGQPGTESEVDGLPRLRANDQWDLSRGGIYFVPAERPRSLRYFDFATRQIHPIFEVNKDFERGLSVSPDGRWILYSLAGDLNNDIMLVDHYR